jgi:hypothetical protein
VAKDWRTLKLEVLAETTQFVKGMDKANATTKSFGDKLGDFAKKAGIAPSGRRCSSWTNGNKDW